MLITDTIFQSQPSTQLQGELVIPGDKSISHRALMLAAIAEGESQLNGLLMGEDNRATLHAMEALGIHFEKLAAQDYRVHGVGLNGLSPAKHALDLGNSGTGIRLLTGLLAGQQFDSELTGDTSLCKRPMDRIVSPLSRMGAKITMSSTKTPPLKIHGGQILHGIEYALPIASAQVKSCLLFAGLYAQGETTIIEPMPSRDHSERMLQAFDYPIKKLTDRIIISGSGKLRAQQIDIPSDISSAAFFLVAASIIPGSDIILKNVGINPTRLGVITILRLMGANIDIFNERKQGNEPVAEIRVRYAPLKGIQIPVDQVPLAIDEFPILMIAAACAEGETILTNAKELRVKETDRIAAMVDGLLTVGIKAKPLSDGMIVEGGVIRGGEVNSYGDHRIAMAFAIAGAVANQTMTIHDCKNVETSFPNFVNCANSIGMQISKTIRRP